MQNRKLLERNVEAKYTIAKVIRNLLFLAVVGSILGLTVKDVELLNIEQLVQVWFELNADDCTESSEGKRNMLLKFVENCLRRKRERIQNVQE